MILVIALLAVLAFLAARGMRIVPHQQMWIVQRLGRFQRVLEPGLNWIIPGIDQVAYRHSMKEEAIEVPEQTAITQDNVSVMLDGIVYIRIFDAMAASYGVKDPINALIQLVQTNMRSEIGKIPLDKTFEEREALNGRIVAAINQASSGWGVRCLRYEVKDIKMPEDIRKAMELQMTAERQKRARILESEGIRQAEINQSEGHARAAINMAEGHRARTVLESEAAQIDQINRARGEAEALAMRSQATAESMDRISAALCREGGELAASLQVAEKYVEAFRHLAKESNTVVLPANLQHPAGFIAEAMAIYGQVKTKTPSVRS